MRWSDWLNARTNRTDSIALARLMELLFEFLTRDLNISPQIAAESLARDYARGGRRDRPGFLKEFLTTEAVKETPLNAAVQLPKRQARHLV
jgi:hypothetical protein